MRARLGAISVDLDSLPHYCRIHGLPESLLDARLRRIVYEVAIPRFLQLFDALGVTGTFFAIGEDLEEPANAAMLGRAHARGVEVGNHTFSHDYAISRQPKLAIEAEVARGEAAIERAIGVRPAGFRAPGYTLSPALYGVLVERGYLYDSSTFPAVPYYAAKAGVMGALRALGRPSRAILDSPRVLLAPTGPYRPRLAQPYARGDGGVLELPITVAPVTRVPFIGTFAAALPTPVVRAVWTTLRGEPLINFELHGVDVLGVDDGLPRELVRQQRDLGLRAQTKIDRLAEVFRWMRDDLEVVTLSAAARAVAKL
ncbi:MAG: polysaccharide deacetylase family protein [Myxococcaceae bacterium]|nr:polysaccharide deacetylase family protein [Myxococcaceae bacterium]